MPFDPNTPRSRDEVLLQAIVSGDSSAMGDPRDREEEFVKAIADKETLPDYSEASDGDVLQIGSDGPEWGAVPNELPAIAAGDAGKVLKVNSGENGVEWGEASGGGHLYAHHIAFTRNVTGGQMQIYFTLITNFNAFADMTALYNYFVTNLPTSGNVFVSCSGRNTGTDDERIYIGIRAVSGDFNIRYIKPTGGYGDQNYAPSWYTFQEHVVQIL